MLDKLKVEEYPIFPHGNKLTDLVVDSETKKELAEQAIHFPSWDLTARQLCDLELLANGGFSPLDRFLGKEDFESVCDNMRLTNGLLWPLPITLDVTPEVAEKASKVGKLALYDPEGVCLAIVDVEETWEIDREKKALSLYSTLDLKHPGVAHIFNRMNNIAIGGKIEVLELPPHYDFVHLRLTPRELRYRFKKWGWRKIVAFQTRNPMHKAHFELTLRAAKELEANLLIHPVVGMTKPGDVDHYTRVRCYQAVMKRYPRGTATLALLPLAMRMGGPREALLHAIIRKNYGCTHFIVGRDHAGPGVDSNGKPFYGPYEAQELVKKYEKELGIKMVPFKMMVYLPEEDRYLPIDEIPKGKKFFSLSGTELRQRLEEGRSVPEWFTFPEVLTELQKTYPPRSKQGFTVFFTGLSGAGKSTLANVLLVKLLEIGGRPVTLLDGDIVRKNLSSELGFSKEHRDINIKRIGFVASEITKNRGVALCAPIAPYDSVRKEVRKMISQYGGFILVYVSTPLEVCEKRDRKGLYKKARMGIIKNFTGISDPYEPPDDADLEIDTTNITPGEAVQQIILHLEKEGFIGPNSNG